MLATVSTSAQSKEDAAVFDTALATFSTQFERMHKVAANFLVLDETTLVLPQDLGFAARDLPKNLVDNLLTYGGAPQPIVSYSPPAPFKLSSPKTLGAAFELGKPGVARPHYYNWDSLRTLFPAATGVLELALPAYSPDGNTALLYFWTGCGNLCASGYLYVLEKSGGKWRVVKTVSPWVS